MAESSFKCATVFVSVGDEYGVYDSIDGVPRPIRRRILAARPGFQTATLLIADEAGRNELLRAAQGKSGHLQLRIFPHPLRPAPRRHVRAARVLAGAIAAAVAGSLLWLAAALR